MRNGLEHLAEIETYLLGQHPDAAAFEQQIQTDTKLRTDVQLIRDLMQAVGTQGLKIEIARAKTTYTLFRALRWLGLSLGFCLLLMAAAVLYTQTGAGDDSKGPRIRTDLPAENEIGGTDWVQADSVLPSLVYTLHADRDEVIETPGGLIISIPQGSLRQKNGKLLAGSYELEVKEALDAANIMKAGLSTWSDGNLLETGGMFYVNMRQNGENLQIPKDAGITVSVPKQQSRSDMMLFDGVRSRQVNSEEDNGWADQEFVHEVDTGMSKPLLTEINWVNPSKPITDLVSIPMERLNFYPPGFETKLAEAGYPNKEKAFKDSVYLSFKFEKEDRLLIQTKIDKTKPQPDSSAENWSIIQTWGEQLFKSNCARCHSINNEKVVGPGLQDVRVRWSSIANLVAWIQNPPAFLKTGDTYANEIFKKYNGSAMPAFPDLSKEDVLAILDFIDGKDNRTTGINPVTVLAFWNKEFDRTLLATKEFETRMRYIHTTCDERLLECYTKNMGDPLYYCDSLAAKLSYGEQQLRFLQFYYQKQGKPTNGKAFTQALLSVFAQKQRELDAAYNRTTGAWYREQAQADQKVVENRINQWERNFNREQSNFNKEFEHNLCEAKKQLGKSCNEQPVFSRNVRENFNTFSLQSTGWKNVDVYVMDATLNRTSMEYTDPATGQKARLTYTPITVTLKNATTYDIREVYLIPSGKLSFMRMRKNGDSFTESLNALYQYHLVAVGYKDNDIFLYTQENITVGSFTVEPKSSTAGALNQFVNRNGSQRAKDDMFYELQSFQLQSTEIKRNALRMEREQLRQALLPVVFPCAMATEAMPLSDTLATK